MIGFLLPWLRWFWSAINDYQRPPSSTIQHRSVNSNFGERQAPWTFHVSETVHRTDVPSRNETKIGGHDQRSKIILSHRTLPLPVPSQHHHTNQIVYHWHYPYCQNISKQWHRPPKNERQVKPVPT
jgi:hypothetical protein